MIAVSRPATIRRTGKAGSAAAMIGSGVREMAESLVTRRPRFVE
jgi:hypothetical protein